LNDLAGVEKSLSRKDVTAIIIEGIQGIAGIYQPSVHFLEGLGGLCKKYGTLLIIDEIQSGYGRSGKIFCPSIQ
jgi:Ornithine/acetylornithine aminotransferase